MKTEKLYFKNIDDTTCYDLQTRIEDAQDEGLEKVTLIEAIPDNGNSDFVWCMHHVDCIEKNECKKSVCDYYKSKSGRGKCENKGNLYLHGEEVTFAVPTEAGI